MWRGWPKRQSAGKPVPDVKRVAYPRRLLERLEDGFATWTVPALGLLTLLMVLVVAQILNVVRLSVFGRRHLIRSMELVGAPPFRIRRPFIGEAMGYGAVGVLLAYSAVVALLGALEPFPVCFGPMGPNGTRPGSRRATVGRPVDDWFERALGGGPLPRSQP